MAEIRLTQGKNAIVDSADYAELSQHKWSYDAYNHMAVRATQTNNNRQRILMHRLITNAPRGMDVDHINGDRLDNRRSNLRVCTHAENMRNTKLRSNNRSGFKGVSWCKKAKKWTVRIRIGDKYAFLGYFTNVQIAAEAYDVAAVRHFGEFARINNVGVNL